MNSERQKREEEVERLMRETDLSRERDVAFQEEVRKAAAAVVEQETSRLRQSERAEARKRPISPATAGIWLLVLGIGLAFSIPGLGAALIIGGVAAIGWLSFPKWSKNIPPQWRRRLFGRDKSFLTKK